MNQKDFFCVDNVLTIVSESLSALTLCHTPFGELAVAQQARLEMDGRTLDILKNNHMLMSVQYLGFYS